MVNTQKIQPVILCGGSGTRLWPISTPAIPKQFISLEGKGTLLEGTIRRVSLVMNECQFGHQSNYTTFTPILIMHHSHKLPPELAKYEKDVVYEDYANDTAVAIGKAAIEVKKRHDNAIMLVLPADHYIYNVDAFVRDIRNGIDKVTEDNIVLYGIDPTEPNTKYGYITSTENGVKFHEKPNITVASELIAKKSLWNSGIFVFNTNLVLKCLSTSRYNIMDWITNPREGKAPSFDVAVLQEYSNIYAHHCSGWNWSDVGTWQSFMDVPEIQSEMKNSAVLANCSNVNVLNRNNSNIVVIGCNDLLVVTNGSNILIMSNTGDYNNQLKEISMKATL